MSVNAALREHYKRNFEAFCRNQLKISTRKPGELIPLELNGAQRILLQRIKDQRKRLGYIRYCCCKSRQSTMSTFAQALCFHSTVLTPQFNSLLIANDDQTTMDIFKMSQRFLTHLSPDIRPMTAQSNVREIVFANPDKRKRYDDPGLGSQIVFLSATKITAGTGSTRHAVHLCLRGDALVFLADGGPLAIAEIQPGMEVQTHRGNRATVVATHSRIAHTELVLVLVEPCQDGIVLTEDHKVWTRRGWIKAGELIPLEDEIGRSIEHGPSWGMVKDVLPVEGKGKEIVYDIEVDHPDHSFETIIGAVANSELSKWNHDSLELIFSSILPAIHLEPGTIIAKESTAFVGGDSFREMCEDARRGQSDDLWFFIPWFCDSKNISPLDPGESIKLTMEEKRIEKLAAKGQPKDDVPPVTMLPEQFKWRRKKILELKSETMWEQEYPCMAEFMRVGTDKGLIPISEVKAGYLTDAGPVTAAWCTGVHPIFRLRTADGYSVTGTAEHPMIQNGGKPIPLSAMMGKSLYLAQPMFATEQYEAVWWDECLKVSLPIDEEFGRFLGYFAGDGCICNVDTVGNGRGRSAVVSIVCDAKDQDVIDDVTHLITRFFGEPQQKRVGSKHGGVEVRKGSQVFLRIAKVLGIYRGPDKPHRKVCVPECIWRSPQSVVREFLRGLFEADACKRKTRSILLFSKYREFLEDVQLLLLGFGIQCRVTTNGRRNANGPYTANELALQAVATDAFGERIGFISRRKRERFALRTRPPRGGYAARPMTMTSQVIAVEDIGKSVPVYDLQVDGSKQFDANGVQVHNCRFEDAWIRLDATIFDHGLLAQMKRDLKKPRRFVTVEPGPKIQTVRLGDGRVDVSSGSDYIAIFQEPEKGVIYDCGVDVAVGAQEASDWSVAEVLRRDTREQVAEMHLHIDPKDLGTKLYWLGMYYNQAQLIVEMNGPGFATHGQLASLAYPYIYIWRHRERDVPSLSTYRGWKTMHDSKQLMVSNSMHRFNHKDVIVRSRVLWQEMYDYVQIAPGVYRATIGHDDAVEAWMICIQGGEDESFGDDAIVAQTQSNDFERQVARDRALQDDVTSAHSVSQRLERIIREQRGIC